MSDTISRKRVRGWVLYDRDCPFCRSLLARVEPTLQAAGFRPEPLQSPWVRERLKLPEGQLLSEMRVITRTQEILGGADALLHLARELNPIRRPWWAWLILIAGKAPFGRPILRAAYRWIAARRSCRSGACSISASPITKKEGAQ